MQEVVLLLGSNDRAALETVRSLGRHGMLTDTIYFEKKDLTEYSRFCRHGYFFGDPFRDYKGFIKKFKDKVSSGKYDLVIPINDVANEIVMSELAFIKKYSKVAAPDIEQYEFGHDKIKTLKVCQEIGVPVPNTQIIDKANLGTRLELAFPVYAKPQYSSLLRNKTLYNFHVRKIKSEEALDNFLRDNINNCQVMLQEPISGYGIGVNVIAEKGKIIAYGLTKRLHEPSNGGNSSYRKSVEIDSRLEEYSTKLIEKINWTGLAMLEFKFDGRDYYLMEINARLWGSVGLSIFSGVNFPVLLYNLFSERQLACKPNYRPGRYTRNMSRDLRWTLKQLSKGKLGLVLKELAVGVYRFVIGKEKIDEFDWKDWRPFFRTFVQIAKRYTGPIFRKKIRIGNRRDLPSFGSDSKILFVCKGNINRSAFASEYLRQKYGMACHSVGTLMKRNRNCSGNAELVAQEYSIEMSNHRSQNIHDVELEQFDYCVIFDDINFGYMHQHFQESMQKVVYIKKDITPDPHGQDVDYFRETFKEIVTQLEQRLKR